MSFLTGRNWVAETEQWWTTGCHTDKGLWPGWLKHWGTVAGAVLYFTLLSCYTRTLWRSLSSSWPPMNWRPSHRIIRQSGMDFYMQMIFLGMFVTHLSFHKRHIPEWFPVTFVSFVYCVTSGFDFLANFQSSGCLTFLPALECSIVTNYRGKNENLIVEIPPKSNHLILLGWKLSVYCRF